MDTASSTRKLNLVYLLFAALPLVVSPLPGIDTHEISQQMVFIWLLSLWLAVAALFALRERKITLPIHRPTLILLAAWALSFIVSTIFSIAPVESFWGTYDRLQGLFIHLFYGLHFLICLSIFRDVIMRKYFLGLTALVGFVVSVYALLQWYFFDKAAFTPLLSFGRRAMSTLGSPTALGQWLIFGIFAAAFFVRFEKKAWRISAVWLGVVAVMLAALMASQNRASVLGIGVALAALLFFRLKKKKYRLFAVAITLVALGGGIFVLNTSSRSLGTREVLWKASLKAAAEAPLIGGGPETMQHTLQKVMPRDLYDYERLTDIADRTHNVFLDALLTRGSLGIGVLLITLAGILVLARRIRSRTAMVSAGALGAYFVAIQFGFSSTVHVVFLLAFLAIFLNETVRFRKPALAFIWPEKAALFGAILFTAAAGMIYSAKLYRSDITFARGLDDYFRSQQLGLETFDEAIRLAPQYAGPYRTVFILMDEYLRKEASARVLLDQYVQKLGPITDGGVHYHLARAALADGEKNYAGADLHFGHASKLAPQWSVIWIEWARSYERRGESAKTAQMLEKVLEIAPSYWRWDRDRPQMSAAQRETARIWRISNASFYEALELLGASYDKLGRFSEALELQKYGLGS